MDSETSEIIESPGPDFYHSIFNDLNAKNTLNAEKVAEIYLSNGQLLFLCSLCATDYPNYDCLQEHLYMSHFQIESQQQSPQQDIEDNDNFIFEEEISIERDDTEQLETVEFEPVYEELETDSPKPIPIIVEKMPEITELIESHDITIPKMTTLTPIIVKNINSVKLDNIKVESNTSEAPAARPFVCQLCNKSFTLKHHLVQHGLIHTGERPHKCDLCGKAFGFKYGLNRHMQRIHMVPKPFRCNTCDVFFFSEESLTTHHCTQNKVKSQKCDLCEKSYATIWELNRHKKSHEKKHLEYLSQGKNSKIPAQLEANTLYLYNT